MLIKFTLPCTLSSTRALIVCNRWPCSAANKSVYSAVWSVCHAARSPWEDDWLMMARKWSAQKLLATLAVLYSLVHLMINGALIGSPVSSQLLITLLDTEQKEPSSSLSSSRGMESIKKIYCLNSIFHNSSQMQGIYISKIYRIILLHRCKWQ